MCYDKCQNILGNVLAHLFEHLSFRLRCSSFLLSKFASQLKLIQSVVQTWIRGICVTSSFLSVLLSGFLVSGLQVPSPRHPVPGSFVSGCHVLGSRVSGSQSLRPRVPSLRVQGPRSQALILDYANQNVKRKIWISQEQKELLRRNIKHFSSFLKGFQLPAKIFCCLSSENSPLGTTFFSDFDRRNRAEMFCKKSVLKNFITFTEKCLCQSIFLNKVAGWGLQHY